MSSPHRPSKIESSEFIIEGERKRDPRSHHDGSRQPSAQLHMPPLRTLLHIPLSLTPFFTSTSLSLSLLHINLSLPQTSSHTSLTYPHSHTFLSHPPHHHLRSLLRRHSTPTSSYRPRSFHSPHNPLRVASLPPVITGALILHFCKSRLTRTSPCLPKPPAAVPSRPESSSARTRSR